MENVKCDCCQRESYIPDSLVDPDYPGGSFNICSLCRELVAIVLWNNRSLDAAIAEVKRFIAAKRIMRGY